MERVELSGGGKERGESVEVSDLVSLDDVMEMVLIVDINYLMMNDS
jgi:hypothetical protein